jgi:hypothetical protein
MSRRSHTVYVEAGDGRRVYEFSDDAPPQPGDERHGDWSREQLERMDAKFCSAMQREVRAK